MFDFFGKKFEQNCPDDFDSDSWRDSYIQESDPERSI